jgi:hypothetical protein
MVPADELGQVSPRAHGHVHSPRLAADSEESGDLVCRISNVIRNRTGSHALRICHFFETLQPNTGRQLRACLTAADMSSTHVNTHGVLRHPGVQQRDLRPCRRPLLKAPDGSRAELRAKAAEMCDLCELGMPLDTASWACRLTPRAGHAA